MGTWIRVETNWQDDPYVVTLGGATRHILQTIWCLAAENGTPTFDDRGEPLHATMPLQFLEPVYVARKAGFEAPIVVAAIEQLRQCIPSTDFSPEIPPRLVVDRKAGLVLVRSLGKYQRALLKDRARKAKTTGTAAPTGPCPDPADSTEDCPDSTESPPISTEPPRNSPDFRGHGTNGTNGTNERTERNVTERDGTNEPNEPVQPSFVGRAFEPDASKAHLRKPEVLDVEAVKAAWNEVLGGTLPRIVEVTDERRKKLKARSRPGRDLAWWREYFARIKAQPFLLGENQRGWKASFDFAIRSDEVVAKILEGAYESHDAASSTTFDPYEPATPRKPVDGDPL